MKAPKILAFLAFYFSSTVRTAPSKALIEDLNVDLYDDTFKNRVQVDDKKLPGGTYHIRSLVFHSNDDLFIGVESKDSFPLLKPVQTVPNISHIAWNVELLDNGNYTLGIFRGFDVKPAPTVQTDHKVFAEWAGVGPPPTEWVITYQKQHNAYTIVWADESYLGWFASADIGGQVQLKPMIVFPIIPPEYLPSELFTFENVVEEDNVQAVVSQKKQDMHVDVMISVEL